MARTRTSSALELLVPLRRDDDEPLHRQLECELRDAIRDGRLASMCEFELEDEEAAFAYADERMRAADDQPRTQS